MKRIIFIFILIQLPLFSFNKSIVFNRIKSIAISYDNQYEMAIAFLKKYESFSAKVYEFPKGCFCIGYGHRIKGNKILNIKENVADSLLRSDFDKHITLIGSQTNLKDQQLYAIALLSFNIGNSKLKKSKLFKMILNNENIKNELLLYCNYKQNGKIIRSEHLLSRRIFEYNMFISKELKIKVTFN